jgi:predicted DNA-binding transcriptional regulator AlpA
VSEERLLDVRMVAERLSISARAFWRLVKSGQAPAGCLVGRLRRWRAAEIDGFIASGCKLPQQQAVEQQSVENGEQADVAS